MSHKVTIIPASGNTPATASVVEAKIADILTTAISTDSALTGTYGLLQKGLLFVGGMAVQNKRRLDSFNPL